jgi:hypothetical protein
MFLMRADALRGEVGGWLALEISSFVGPSEIARADRRVQFGAHCIPGTILLELGAWTNEL